MQKDFCNKICQQRPFAGYGKFVRLGLDIRNMNSPLIENRTAHGGPADQWKRLDLRDRTMMGEEEDPVAIWPPNGSVIRFAQPRGALTRGLEHDLNVGRRARDDAEDFARACPQLVDSQASDCVIHGRSA